MFFNSLEFAFYFAAIFAAFWLIVLLGSAYRSDASVKTSVTLRNGLLLGAGFYYYYLFHPYFPLYLGGMIVVSYVLARFISATERAWLRSVLRYCSVFLLCIGLVYLKYSGLLAQSIPRLAPWQASALHLLAPLGISFYTFSSVGYVLDVYNGKMEAERNPVVLASYLAFFPYLLIGPIPSARTILPQFREKPTLTRKDIEQSIGEIMWGLFKKVVVADNLSLGVSYCFKQSAHLNGSTLFIGVVLFYLYLYADFSGYSDMARGLARLLGIRIVRNFNMPFNAAKVTEFWRKWHISLTNWFNEYIFNPTVILLRNWGKVSVAIALFLTFGISGLWHGADWKFGIWGLLHAAAMTYEYYTQRFRNRVLGVLPRWVSRGIGISFTMFYIVLAETFFRADSIGDAVTMTGKMLSLSLFAAPVAFIAKYLYWAIPMLAVELVQLRGDYAFDLDFRGLPAAVEKTIKNKSVATAVNIFLKLILYLVLGYCTWLFRKKMNMADYYYFKF